ncbi:radical SAM protein [Thermolongibacillus altinsuensis]|uniref:radical SAM protein n=1 Tax=Thermolongibacillus altinsuensis TaxID=575256 RepID=UPI0025565B0F|nr:radical SAM protein [Thermolongibacillus altinsuensis]
MSTLEKRGFYFSTMNNSYFYDDTTGNVSVVDKVPNKRVVFGKQRYEFKAANREEIEKFIHENGFRQLILIVTENCNLRCKYCVYSGNYENSRTHNYFKMDSSIAKEAVFKYLSSISNIKKKKPFLIPIIGFYGGEPLLNYALIKEIVTYSKQIYNGEIYFNMTTNATLLDEEKIEFLVHNNFLLSISLNGYKEENDRMRVYANNKGTFDDVMEKIRYIKTKYPDYYRTNCQIIGVYDVGTDLHKLREFYSTNELVKNKLTMLLQVSDVCTDWYDQYSDDQKNNFKKQLKELKQIFIKKVMNGEKLDPVLRLLFALPLYEIINRPLNVSIQELRPSFLPFTGTCVPGTKIAVDTKGILHSCEKVNDKMPIGTTKKWIDFEKITETLDRYNKHVGPGCINCPIQRFCPTCYRVLLTAQGEFNRKQMKPCQKLIEEKQRIFELAYTLMEKNVNLGNILER